MEILPIEGLFDIPGVHVLTAEIGDAAIASLTPPEAACVARAVHKRRREFATGRFLARYALDHYFGIRDFDLLRADDRAPVWPSGVAGSVSHTDSRAWVAVVDASQATIGIDGEGRAEMEPALWRMVFLEAEVEYLKDIEPSERNRRALVLFSAKESLFKAQYPRTGQYLGFKAVCVRLCETGQIDYEFQVSAGAFQVGDVCKGRWRDDGCVLTSAWIPAP